MCNKAATRARRISVPGRWTCSATSQHYRQCQEPSSWSSLMTSPSCCRRTCPRRGGHRSGDDLAPGAHHCPRHSAEPGQTQGTPAWRTTGGSPQVRKPTRPRLCRLPRRAWPLWVVQWAHKTSSAATCYSRLWATSQRSCDSSSSWMIRNLRSSFCGSRPRRTIPSFCARWPRTSSRKLQPNTIPWSPGPEPTLLLGPMPRYFNFHI